MQSSSKFALMTIRPPKSASPSSGLCTTPGISSEYDDRAAARVSTSDSQERQALTDHDGVYGSLEFAHAAKHFGVRPITGAELTLADRSHVTVLVESAKGYANLCRLITAAHAETRPVGRESQPAADPALDQRLLEELNEGLVCLSGCARHGVAVRNPNGAARLARAFGRERFFVELQRPYERGDR